MKPKAHWLLALLSTALISTFAGCGNKEAEAPIPAPKAVVPVAEPERPAVAPLAPTVVAPDARLAETEAAIKAREYDKAVEKLIALQHAQLNEQQAAAAAAQMRQLQSSLANALASGDPRAKAAAERLRQSSMAR